MAFDQAWEHIFRNQEWGKYPCEEVIRFVAKNFYRVVDRKSVRILDLGCGGGAHTWYLCREGFTVFAIDGSRSAIQQTKKLLADNDLVGNLYIGDINKLPFDDESFDAIIDCNTIQHNLWDDIVTIHEEIRRVLKPQGQFFSMMLSEETSGSRSALKVENNTYKGFNSSFISPNILAHLFAPDELKVLFEDYSDRQLSRLERSVCDGDDRIAHYIISARKKSVCLSTKS